MSKYNAFEHHKSICEGIHEIYKKKNSDYGFAIEKGVDRLGPSYILGQLWNKYQRAENLLLGARQQVKDEAIEDTLLDMANYAIEYVRILQANRLKNEPVKDTKPNVKPNVKSNVKPNVKPNTKQDTKQDTNEPLEECPCGCGAKRPKREIEEEMKFVNEVFLSFLNDKEFLGEDIALEKAIDTIVDKAFKVEQKKSKEINKDMTNIGKLIYTNKIEIPKELLDKGTIEEILDYVNSKLK